MDLGFHRKYFPETCYIISLLLKLIKFYRQYGQEKYLHAMKVNKEKFACLNKA